MRLNAISLALSLASAVTLSGCNDDSSTSSTTPSTPSANSYSVTAIDGYLRNARVWLDLNGNYVLDEGEPNALSGIGGVADLDVTNIANPEQYPVVVQAIAGQTEDEDDLGVLISDDYMMSAPAGEKDVTPLTTLVHVLIEQNTTDSDDAAAIEAAKQAAIQQVADQLGLDETQILGDFVESGVQAAAYAAENIVDANVLPTTPTELEQVAEDSANGTKFLSVTASVNNKIKQKIEDVAEGNGTTFDNVGGATVGINFSVDDDDDGVPNDLDDFPNDPTESLDSDGDRTGNNADLNDDTVDGEDDIYPDAIDAFPTDRSRAGDHDLDGIDSVDDAFPQDKTEWSDNDSDGYGDNIDLFDDDASEWADADADGYGDNQDPFDDDPTEWADADSDGYGDNQDLFDDDPTEWADGDNDGLGDNEDDQYLNDTDNDGYNNDIDEFPTDETEWVDADSDGLGDNEDDQYPNDSDNDGYANDVDAFPNDSTEWADADNDGLGDNEDDQYPGDGDNDGVADESDNCPATPNTNQADEDKDGLGDACDSNSALTWDNTNWDDATWQ
ncbi:hypothetical protein EJ063_10725 [Vibrio aquaticus]|uniref:Thrombospondin n=1 Tax=Vibrio aquaticus TaxID=2496559 RepID=A0A3S0N4Z9_9VIBR|nr:hypothetical protein [Vibrio aquaticus]RTZ15550.1 hypothetical protein EJ063_10725 [Vibrio aquaticus]